MGKRKRRQYAEGEEEKQAFDKKVQEENKIHLNTLAGPGVIIIPQVSSKKPSSTSL